MKKLVMNIACAVALLSGLAGLSVPSHAFAASAALGTVCSWETVHYSWGYQVWNVCETVGVHMETLEAEVDITYELIAEVVYT